MTGAAETGTIAPIRKLVPTRPTIIFLKVFILCFSISMMPSLLFVYECPLNIVGKLRAHLIFTLQHTAGSSAA
ncbi:hypothetical protein DK867_04240 [Ochrobactrum sp. POC9]|nr:hypothetical protein DK867_04240 [Ochrobactrum sp. POC9]